MFYQNVRGLRTKLSDIFSSVFTSEDYDIIYLTETWLCSDIDSSVLFDNRYLVFRRDRESMSGTCKRGGGVLIAIKKCFSAAQIVVHELELECLWISVNLKYRKKMLLCVVYFPPMSNYDEYVKFFLLFCAV
jgi:hypothetical protein